VCHVAYLIEGKISMDGPLEIRYQVTNCGLYGFTGYFIILKYLKILCDFSLALNLKIKCYLNKIVFVDNK